MSLIVTVIAVISYTVPVFRILPVLSKYYSNTCSNKEAIINIKMRLKLKREYRRLKEQYLKNYDLWDLLRQEKICIFTTFGSGMWGLNTHGRVCLR